MSGACGFGACIRSSFIAKAHIEVFLCSGPGYTLNENSSKRASPGKEPFAAWNKQLSAENEDIGG